MKEVIKIGLGCILLLTVFACNIKVKDKNTGAKASKSEFNRPNIIYILADDLGYGDLGVYGQKKFKTPNIDKLAKDGMLFTQHYSGSTVCAPSRSTLMTGMHTGHTVVRGNKEIRPEGQYPIPDSTHTIAEALKAQGYATGIFGKWGLGYPGSEGDPMNQGFDTFFGYNCQRLGHNYYPRHLWSNIDSVVIDENQGQLKGVYAPELIHKKTLQFIDDHKNRPFFLYVATIIPHAELAAPEYLMQKHRGKYPPEIAFEGYDKGPEYRQGPYESQKEPNAAFAAMMDLLDQQVGEIVQKLEDLGLTDNTLLVFTSDNGPHQEGGANPAYFNSNANLKGYKRDLYEGGIRVPMIVKWPGTIRPGSTTDHISAFWDVFPTVVELAGGQPSEGLDGISILPTLMGNSGEQEKHDYLYWEFHEKGGRQAIRKGKWKAVKYNVFNGDSELELYDLSEDIQEEENVAELHPHIVAEMEQIMQDARTPSSVFKFSQKTYLNSK